MSDPAAECNCDQAIALKAKLAKVESMRKGELAAHQAICQKLAAAESRVRAVESMVHEERLRALHDGYHGACDAEDDPHDKCDLTQVLRAAAAMGRAEALEEAAKLAECTVAGTPDWALGRHIGSAIRALAKRTAGGG